MFREQEYLPLFWQDMVMDPRAQAMITRRRHRYVKGAKELEEQGYRPITQVTLNSGRLLRIGDRDLLALVYNDVRDKEEKRVRAAAGGREVDILKRDGALVPLVYPAKIRRSKDIHAFQNGFTLFVKELEPPRLTVTFDVNISLLKENLSQAS